MKLLALLQLLAVADGVFAANVVSMNIARTPVGSIVETSSSRRRLGKRATITESLINNVTAGSYMATVQVGTPPQTLMLALDTGSSDVWMLSSTADLCTEQHRNPEEDCEGGTFDSSASSTFVDLIPNGFQIQYQDGTGAEGDYITDNFAVGGSTIKALQMGLGFNSTVTVGIMGIGYDTNEASQSVPGGKQYPNFIDELLSQKLINAKAYSLWLDDLAASTGSILFGGIDTEKYIGDLVSVPVQPDDTQGENVITSFTVALTSLSATGQAGNTTSLGSSSDFPTPVILDSGTTLTYIPDDLAADIYTIFGAVNDVENSGNVYANCDLETSDASATVNYQFGSSSGPTVKVAISELLFPIPSDEFGFQSAPFTNTCLFGIFPGSPGPYLLGDTFIRSAYLSYDLTNNEIGIAQTDFGATGSNIVEFQTNPSGIPDVSGVASGAAVTQTATGQPGVGATSSASGSSSTSGSTAIRTMTFSASGFAVLAVSGVFSLIGGGLFAVL